MYNGHKNYRALRRYEYPKKQLFHGVWRKEARMLVLRGVFYLRSISFSKEVRTHSESMRSDGVENWKRILKI